MKRITFLSFFALLLLLNACKDDDTTVTDFDYHVHIHQPNADDKHVGDTVHIHVDFESHTSEIVHNVNVRIYNKADNTEVLSAPDNGHVHATDGIYSYHGDFELSDANGVSEHTDWVLEAKVWGHAEGEAEVVETVEFHVHPM